MNNRQYKFRVWDAESKTMLRPGILETYVSLGTTVEYPGPPNVRSTMMYTGRLDKDGAEMCEGDIIEFDASEWGTHTPPKFIISWDTDKAGFDFGGGAGKSDDKFRKIIGNVFEHNTNI